MTIGALRCWLHGGRAARYALALPALPILLAGGASFFAIACLYYLPCLQTERHDAAFIRHRADSRVPAHRRINSCVYLAARCAARHAAAAHK